MNLLKKLQIKPEYFWVAYPKGSSKINSDLNRDILSAE